MTAAQKGEPVALDAVALDGSGAGRYAVRPAGQLGTCGFYPVAWTVQYIRASSARDAIRKAQPIRRPVQS